MSGEWVVSAMAHDPYEHYLTGPFDSKAEAEAAAAELRADGWGALPMQVEPWQTTQASVDAARVAVTA